MPYIHPEVVKSANSRSSIEDVNARSSIENVKTQNQEKSVEGTHASYDNLSSNKRGSLENPSTIRKGPSIIVQNVDGSCTENSGNDASGSSEQHIMKNTSSGQLIINSISGISGKGTGKSAGKVMSIQTNDGRSSSSASSDSFMSPNPRSCLTLAIGITEIFHALSNTSASALAVPITIYFNGQYSAPLFVCSFVCLLCKGIGLF